MKRARTQLAKVRLSLDLPAQDSAVLDRLAEEVGGSKTEVVKRAIALMETALAAKAKGHTLAVAAGDRLVSTIIL